MTILDTGPVTGISPDDIPNMDPGRRIEELGDTDQLNGDNIVPGFSVLVSELFPPVATHA